MTPQSLFPGLSPLRTPPSNIQAEQSVLGSILSNSKSLLLVSEFLRPEHFADAPNGRIYAECARRVLAGGVADAISMKGWWERDVDSEVLEGFTYLTRLVVANMGPHLLVPYARVVHDTWMRREVIDAGEQLVAAAFDGSRPVAESVSTATGAIERAVVIGSAAMPIIAFNQALDEAIADAEARYRGEPSRAIRTGMRTVDDATGGMEPGTMIVLAGAVGMGKSAIGHAWGINVARRARKLMDDGAALSDVPGVATISLEMTGKQLGRRALSAAAGISVQQIKRGQLNDAEWALVTKARREMDSLPLSIVDTSGLTVQQIRLQLRGIRRRHGLGLIIVDHMHIVTPEERDVRNGSTAAVGKISEALMHLAKEFDVPLLCLAQLSRGLLSRDDKRPTKADLRQSGEIEANADTIMFVHRPEYYLSKGQLEQRPGEKIETFQARVRDDDEMRIRVAGKAELILAKVRDGEEQVIPLLFDGPTTSFREAPTYGDQSW